MRKRCLDWIASMWIRL